MKPHIITLNNGLRIMFVDTQAFPTLTTLLLVGAGSRYETKENNGIAHFFEHMAFKGSKKYPDSFTISSTIESLGGVFNAFTSKDHTGYWIKATAQHFETVADVLADMVLSPLLLTEEINREKGVIIEEINMYEDMPARKVGDIYEELLYDGSPLGFDIAGTKQTVSSFTKETFVDYINELYHPSNAVLIVAGGFEQYHKQSGRASHEDMYEPYLKILSERFSKWQDGKNSTFEKVTENQKKPAMHVRHKKTEQTHFCYGFRAFAMEDPRRYGLSVLTALLGGGMSSRLFMQVRERRGLCYYISTGREMYADVGNVVTQAGVTNDVAKINEALKVIWEEHQKIVRGEITDDEVTKAKEFMKGRLLLSMEDSFTVASFYGTRQLLEKEIISPTEVVQKIDTVKKEEIIAIAKELFTPERFNFAVIGPIEKEQLDFSFLG